VSRGLSDQQRRILGLAYAFNAQLNGGEYRQHENIQPAGDRYREGYRHLLVSESPRPWDVKAWMVMHYVGGLDLAWPPNEDRRFAHDRRSKSVKASTTRAMRLLWERELIAAHTWVRSNRCRSKSYGYTLTPAGAEIARQQAPATPDLVQTVARHTGDWRRCGELIEKSEAADIFAAAGISYQCTNLREGNSYPVEISPQGNGYPREGGRPEVTVSCGDVIEGECYQIAGPSKKVTDTEAAA